MSTEQQSIAGMTPPESAGLPGPFAVGRYAGELRDRLRKIARVQLIGEVTGLRIARKGVYFELRDAQGAIPCAMWRTDWDALDLPDGAVRDGAEVVVLGGPDFYPGSSTASPAFSFRCTRLRLAGEGDLLARLADLRRKLSAEGLFELQRALPRPALPRTIGIVTGGGSAAEADVLAGLRRRGWAGRAVFANPPVQDRHAAPKIARALSDLASIPEVEVVVVARGGGSLADLWAFCDETLCRTVAMLRVPVITGVGHEVDRTLIDDVAAVACSTPTHAAEAAIGIDVGAARGRLCVTTGALRRAASDAASTRARRLVSTARTLGRHHESQYRHLHQMLREIRRSAARVLDRGSGDGARRALVLARRREATLHGAEVAGRSLTVRARSLARQERAASSGRAAALERIAQTLAAHEPERVLERGYAIVSDGEVPTDDAVIVTSAAQAQERSRLRVRFADDDVLTEVSDRER